MIKLLTGKNQKKVAWLLLFVFYGDFLAAYASGKSVSEDFAIRYNYWTTVAPLQKKNNPEVNPANPVEPVKLMDEALPVDAIKIIAELPAEKKENEKPEIGGPGQPEMSTFKSVGADNMVNLFTGDFSYNIPLLDVAGYPVNIFYNAGATMDQEASWVGLGWNINPGTISRNMRGLPDDYNGQDVIKKTQSMKPDITVGVTGAVGAEITGVPLSLNLSAGIFYNNRRGIGLETGTGFDYKPLQKLAFENKDYKTQKDTLSTLTLSAGINLNSQNGMRLNSGFSVYKFGKEDMTKRGLNTSLGYSSRQGLTDLTISAEVQKYKWSENKSKGLESAGSGSAPISDISFARSSFMPSIRMPVTRFNQFFSVKLGTEYYVLFINGTVGAYVNQSRILKADQEQVKPAYGYMNYEKANDDKNAMLDFNRLQDGVYTHKTPVISIPVYTYDVFSISGEGTGGSFRGYRGNMGYVRDNVSKTRSGSVTVSLDLGTASLVHVGGMFGGVYSPTEVGEWKNGNTLRQTAKFKKTDSLYETFYFKNPGEQAIIDQDYYNKVGGDQLIRPYLVNTGAATPLLAGSFQVFDKDLKVERTVPIDADAYRKVRDKRTQLITYFTAEEADKVGLDKPIYSYAENVFLPGSCSNPLIRTPVKRYNSNDPTFYRKWNHLSEIDVLEADGRRYVYGIPVYQIKQKEVTFSTESVPATGTQLIGYTPGDENSVDNKKGRDGFYQSEELNGYAHSFLLTGILSPDYMDVTGDGITDDDKGTAVKFNYSRVNKKKLGLNYWNVYKWRMPVAENTANYNEGLKADSKDDKGLYTYGEKELWYMHSIESKNMVATFHVSNRRDGNPVANDNGGRDNSTGRTIQKKLDKINLYTKADFLKYGSNARPVKTVHFQYEYSLCPNYPLNDETPELRNNVNINANKGKLTLVAIWFSYNGNNNQVKNKYLFKYAEKLVNNVNVLNPPYNSAENDRWGNYQSHLDNPLENPLDNSSQVGNNYYPYSNQDPAKSNDYARAWNLEKILLPGGAVMNVQYEADDYGYVQDKRASQMTKVAGFGKDPTSPAGTTPSDKLYSLNINQLATPALMDHRFVFFDLPQPLQTKNEIAEKYLQNFKQLLLKLWIKMPRGNVGQQPAFEPVVIYGAIKNFDFALNSNGSKNYNRFYVELSPTSRGGSPIMETVMQFLKDQLPGRAYPGYDVKDGNALVQLVRAVFGMMNSFWQGVMGFERDLKLNGKCKEAKLSMSFARLNNTSLKKLGGGHRVKQIIIADNWNKMTTGQVGPKDSYYGQLYDYSITGTINNQSVNISSGVASYEPGIGNEENPFREVISYSEKQFLGPTDHSNIELPLAETFFPAPVVGYSKVTVKSIHNKDNKNIKSGIGMQQTEFYTTRDFPVISDFTSFDNFSRDHHKPGVIQKIFNFDKKDYLTLTQGVRVVLNDMNGKLKSQSSFAENDFQTPINFTGYYYRKTRVGENKYKLDNLLPVISGPDGKITNKLVGKDVEVMNDFREHISYTYAANIPVNAEIFTVGVWPVIIPTIFRMAFRDKSMYRSATTLKVVNEYGIIDSVVNIDKGSVVGTKNLVYDAETGGVLVSRTYNEFKRPVYQFNYPAWWVNTGMEPAYKNIDLTYKNVLFRNGRIEESSQVNMDYFESGDEIYVADGTKDVAQTAGCVGLGDPPILTKSSEYRIWAVDIRKDTRNTEKEFIFIDRYGNPYNAANATIRIIRSGKRNITNASVGSIVSLNSPIQQYTLLGQTLEKVVIDNNTDVINAGAAEFKEKWRVTDMFYAKDSVMRIVRQAPILSQVIGTTSSAMFGEYNDAYTCFPFPFGTCFHRYKELFQNPSVFMAARNDIGPNQDDYRYKSWLLFNFDNISTLNANSNVFSAWINLPAHRDNHNLTVSGHYAHTSHNYFSSHYRSYNYENRFVISRMLSGWPSFSNYNEWFRQHQLSPPAGIQNQRNIQGTAYPPDWSNINYYEKITDIVRGMLKDKFDPTKNFATALKINNERESGRTMTVPRVCFNNTPSNPITIDLKYYNCDASNPIVYQGNANGAPTVPPPGYAFCNTDETFKLCLSYFSKKQMNPYVEGVLGNWRAFRSYVYYGERRESDPAVPTDIRKDGIINNFETYWAFDNANIQLGKTNSAKWVWNSEITQYNRKGAELEDHDPLGRYNAGIYGYQESLPVAVVNNSRLRLSAFDGFEDYYYKDDPCEPYCKPSKRHFPTGITPAMLDSTQSHTGRYSVKVNAAASYTMDVKVSADDMEATPDVRIKFDKNPYQAVTSVNPKGIGLKGYYYNDNTWGGTAIIREDPLPWGGRDINLNFRARNNGNCYNRDWDDPPNGVRCSQMSIRWKGKIQVTTSGYYEFLSSNADDEAYIHINGTQVATDTWAGVHTRTPVYIAAGPPVPIQVDFRQFNGYGSIQLQWKVPGQNNFVPIDKKYLYPEDKDYLANGTWTTQLVYCEKPDTIQAINHHLIDSFNLISGKQMVISAWVKKGSQDCKCTGYTNVSIKVKDANGAEIKTLEPKERVIEGWQQFEAVFTVPAGNKIKLEFNGPSDAALYFDDLRLHPFNANMKSFVYNPVTLRLAAELDENNYASMYEYDDDGSLIRVKKETKQGIKTITETRSGIQKNITDF